MSKSHVIERLTLGPGEVLVLPPPEMRALRSMTIEWAYFCPPAAGPGLPSGADPLAHLDRSITDLTIKRLVCQHGDVGDAVKVVASQGRVIQVTGAAPPAAGPQPTDPIMRGCRGLDAPPGCNRAIHYELRFEPGQPPKVESLAVN